MALALALALPCPLDKPLPMMTRVSKLVSEFTHCPMLPVISTAGLTSALCCRFHPLLAPHPFRMAPGPS